MTHLDDSGTNKVSIGVTMNKKRGDRSTAGNSKESELMQETNIKDPTDPLNDVINLITGTAIARGFFFNF